MLPKQPVDDVSGQQLLRRSSNSAAASAVGSRDEQQQQQQQQQGATTRPFGFGAVFPSFSPRSSGAGDSDWTMAEEKLLRDVAAWLSPADLRRARLVCRSWCGALATLTTKAVTPPEVAVGQWREQLEALVAAFPCLQELTVGGRVSGMAAQQLGVLAGARQLHALNIPHAQALQDRSLLALQPLAPHLRELRINGAGSLSRRALLLLSVLANLETLELKNCGKVSWVELQQAWKAACDAYEAQAAAEAASQHLQGHSSTTGGDSGSGGSNSSSSGGGSISLGSVLGSWLPGARLFRTSSPASTSIHSAIASQRAGGPPGGLLARVQDLARGTSGAAAVGAGAHLGIGAVGNGRSSCGGGPPEAAARSLLHRKQKLGAAASFSSYEQAVARRALRSDGSSEALGGDGPCLEHPAASGCFPAVRSGGPLLRLRTVSALRARASADALPDSPPRMPSVLARVGSLVWSGSGSSALPAADSVGMALGATASGVPCSRASSGTCSSASSSSSSSPSLAAQTSCMQAALLAYIAEEDAAAAAASATASSTAAPQLALPSAPVPADIPPLPPVTAMHFASAGSSSSSSPQGAGASSVGQSSSTAHPPPQQAQPQQAVGAGPPPPAPQLYKPRRRTTGDKGLPAMPFTKLRSLSFTCSEVTLRAASAELAAVASISSLTALEIGKCKLPDAVFGQLRGLTRLSKLKLAGLWSMGDAGMAELAQLTSLASLALSEAMHVSGAGLLALTALSGLTSLAVGLAQDVGAGVMGRVVVTLPLLQCLEVAMPSWSDADCELLAHHAATLAAAAGASGRRPQSPQQQSIWDDAAPAAASSPDPCMLWEVAAASSAASSRAAAASRPSSSRQLLASLIGHAGGAASAAGASLHRRPPSFSACRGPSFGSFSRGSSFLARRSTSPQQQLGGVAPTSARARQAQKQQHLRVLRLHGCRGLSLQGVAALRQLPELHTLLLDSCRGVPAGEYISQGLMPPTLSALSLREQPFGDLFSGCITMPACGMHLTRLELATLEGVHDGQLRRVLSFFPRLRDLSLAGCVDVGDAAVVHLPMLGALQRLNLGGTSVTGQSFEHLARLPALRGLVLRGCSRLGDAGLGRLLDAPALEELDVAECGGVSEAALVAVLQALPRLVRLDVAGCKAASPTLLAACPHFVSLHHSLAA